MPFLTHSPVIATAPPRDTLPPTLTSSPRIPQASSFCAGEDIRSSILFDCAVEQFRVSFEILQVLETYGCHVPIHRGSMNDRNRPVWIGKNRFLPHVYHYVCRGQRIQLTMPAFPCKSLNRENKVLGHLPDLGEELALRRLQALTIDITKVYAPGAQVTIATDGVLFNDIIGITDEDCWEYGEALKVMIKTNSLTNLTLCRPQQILGLCGYDESTRAGYLASVARCRSELEERFASPEDVIRARILGDKDTEMTYCGMVKFLESELQTSKQLQGISNMAKRKLTKLKAQKMIQRSEAFTLAISTVWPLHIRLSMHPSSGAAKLSFPLVPDSRGEFQKSPWHSCVVVDGNGNYRCVHSKEVKDTHELVYKLGRPWFYR